jgi:YrbI family 3-deoxy-D-manno-octulosonate 8-phosphate phosphatase
LDGVVAEGEVLAIIPARGGSKSIPRKNIRPFAGHPLLAYSIAAGLKAERVTRVIVSTDDEEIAGVSRAYGAEVPFLRPAELAGDSTPDFPVFKQALDWLGEHEGYSPEVVVQLRPTSPLRPVDCVDRAVALLLEHPQADSVRGVVPSGQNPYKMWQVLEDGRMKALMGHEFDEPYNMPRQDLPQTYWQTGHIDAVRTSTILIKGSMSGEVVLPLFIDPEYTVDIDTDRDWQRAEWVLGRGEIRAVRPGSTPRAFPDVVELLVLDFDGVMTDDRVWVDAEGREMVAAHRGDGMGIALLRERGVEVVVLSREPGGVVAARCEKLKIPCYQGLEDKSGVLAGLMREKEIGSEAVIYLGNDVNDLSCFPVAGFAAAVSDAHPQVKCAADLVLSRKGGHGAVRELCDQILEKMDEDGDE